MEVDFYILAPPLMPSNHLSEPVKGECSYPPPASSPCFPPVVSRKATEKHGCCLIPSLSSLSLFQLENTGRSLQPPRQTTTKTCVSCLPFIYPLVCWLNHFTPAINKRTNGWMSIPSDYWFTNRQDVYFLRENYTEHFNFVDFLFVSWILPLWPLPGFFAKKRKTILLECTDPPPYTTPQTHTQVQ